MILFKPEGSNTTYRVDFDKQVKKTDSVQLPENKNKKENGTEELPAREDLTMEQIEENYYQETPIVKIDGSFAKYETRVHKLMEANPEMTREQAMKEVKNKLSQKGVSVIETSDMKEGEEKEEKTEDMYKKMDKKTEEEEEEEEEEEDKKKTDTVDIIETLKKENKDLKKGLTEALDFIDKIKTQKAEETELKRQEKLKQIVNDFAGIDTGKLKNKTLEELTEYEEILASALRKDTAEEKEKEKEEIKITTDMLDMKSESLNERYRCKL